MQSLPDAKLLDPRQPRFGAGITSIFALAAVILGILGQDSLVAICYAYTTFMFIWAVVFRKVTHPYSMLYKVIRKFLDEPKYLEDPRAPFFAQKIGLIVSSCALVFSVLSPAVGIAFGVMLLIASALNAYFNVCIGCIMYLRLRKIGINI
jgi:hypothetical protein